MFGNRPILLVEDGQAASPAVGTVLKELGISHGVIRASSPSEARAYLSKRSTEKPAVILVDGSCSSDHVPDLIKAAKADERLRDTPIIVFSPSGKGEVVNTSFDLGAAGYVVKPSDRKQLAEVLRAIHRYWTLSRVPSDI